VLQRLETAATTGWVRVRGVDAPAVGNRRYYRWGSQNVNYLFVLGMNKLIYPQNVNYLFVLGLNKLIYPQNVIFLFVLGVNRKIFTIFVPN